MTVRNIVTLGCHRHRAHQNNHQPSDAAGRDRHTNSTHRNAGRTNGHQHRDRDRHRHRHPTSANRDRHNDRDQDQYRHSASRHRHSASRHRHSASRHRHSHRHNAETQITAKLLPGVAPLNAGEVAAQHPPPRGKGRQKGSCPPYAPSGCCHFAATPDPEDDPREAANGLSSSGPAWTRTRDLPIMSRLL